MPMHLGLDIGSESIKIVAVDKQGDKHILTAMSHGPTPVGALKSKNEIEEQSLIAAVKAVVDSSRAKTKDVVCALHESDVFTRVVQMPSLSDRELSSAMRWEAEQVIPLPIDEVIYQHQVIRRPEKDVPGAKMDVFLIAAPKALIDRYQRILLGAGLHPKALETEMVALARSLVGSNPYSPTTLILDFGAEATDMSVVKNGFIAFTRSISSGGAALTRAIAAELGFEMAQAESYKRTYGLVANQMEGKINHAMQPVIAIVLEEIKRVLAYYAERNPKDPVRRITLAGGSARLPGFVVEIATALGVEVQMADPFFNISHRPTQELADEGPRFAVAAGLSLKEDF